MSTEEPNCCYRELFVEKRKGARLVHDFSLTIGFSSETRWTNSKNSNEFVEFGLRRADLHLELVNGKIDLKEGDKLGGELQLTVQKKISSRKKTEDKKTETKIGTIVSVTPSFKIDSDGDEHQKESEYRSEQQAIHVTVHGNLSDSERPFWTFIPVEGHLLNGKLTMAPLCTVKAKSKCNFTYSHRIVVHLNDIDITYIPKNWTDIILPFNGLRTQKIKCRIRGTISESEKLLEMQSA